MKKLALLLSVFALTFTSCSSGGDDSSETTDPSAVLPKKIVTEYPDGDLIDNYSYNGTKISKIESNDGYKIVFTYTGDLITKVETFFDGDLETTELYAYDSLGKLISYAMNDASFPDFNSLETYVHNANGTISFTRNIDGEVYSTGTFTMTGNDILNVVSNYDFEPFTTTNSYTYDTKFSPFKNITGYKWYAIAGSENIGFGLDHNILTYTDSETPSNNSTSTYTYNSLNFPITETNTEDGETLTSTVTYN